MDDNPFNLNLLRGWRRTELRLLKEFADHPTVSQTMISGASGLPAGSHALGGRITPLTRAGLILKSGKDDNGQFLWQLNEKKVDRQELLDMLDEMSI